MSWLDALPRPPDLEEIASALADQSAYEHGSLIDPLCLPKNASVLVSAPLPAKPGSGLAHRPGSAAVTTR
jgi:hypothetical protein